MNSLDKLALSWGSRLPMVMQTEAAECGVACLAMIVGYHGQPCEITELRRRLSVSLKGTSLKHLVGMAERLGFAARPLRLELDELRQLSDAVHPALGSAPLRRARQGHERRDRDSRPGGRGAPRADGRGVEAFHGRRARVDAGG